MSDVAIALAGVVLVLAGGFGLASPDKTPARWWKPDELARARTPSQPGNAVIALVLGLAAMVFGVIHLV